MFDFDTFLTRYIENENINKEIKNYIYYLFKELEIDSSSIAPEVKSYKELKNAIDMKGIVNLSSHDNTLKLRIENFCEYILFHVFDLKNEKSFFDMFINKTDISDIKIITRNFNELDGALIGKTHEMNSGRKYSVKYFNQDSLKYVDDNLEIQWLEGIGVKADCEFETFMINKEYNTDVIDVTFSIIKKYKKKNI